MIWALADLQGQEAMARRLTGLIASGRLPHAMLFEGPDEAGQRGAAMALAAFLLCRKPLDPGHACAECSGCLKVASGNHADLHVVRGEDGAQIKIAEVRAVEQALLLRAMESGRKVVLIDDAHRMTLQAQSALLKTLEEPRGPTFLILTTSRPGDLLNTIRSRCQRFLFRARRLEINVEARAAMDDLDRRLFGRAPQSAIDSLEIAADLGRERTSMVRSLDMLAALLRDQAIAASETDEAMVNEDMRTELESRAHARGLPAVLSRFRTVMHARSQVDVLRLNATMVAERLCLTLAGHVGEDRR